MSNSESQALAQVNSITDLFNLSTWSNNIENLGFRYFQKDAFDTLYGDKKEVKEFLGYEKLGDLEKVGELRDSVFSLGFKFLADRAFEVMYGDRKEVQKCKWCDEEISTDRISDLVYEQPLEVSTRSDWQQSQEDYEASEFNILLCTGGPAVRIFGSCDDGYPQNIELQHQDWFTPWETVHNVSDNQKDAMEWFCNFFVYS